MAKLTAAQQLKNAKAQHKLSMERPKRSPLAGPKPKKIENKLSSENIAKSKEKRRKAAQASGSGVSGEGKKELKGASRKAPRRMSGKAHRWAAKGKQQ